MGKSFWIALAIVAIAIAAFFGFKAIKDSKATEAARAQGTTLQRELEEARLKEKEASRRADLEAEARRMGELKSKQEAEAEARRLAQAQAERDDRETARARAETEAARALASLEEARVDKARLEVEARRLAELRAREAAESQQQLEAAQRALASSEKSKDAEIERQAALLASYSNQAPNAVQARDAATAPEARDNYRIIYPIDYKRSSHYAFGRLRNSTTTPEPAPAAPAAAP